MAAAVPLAPTLNLAAPLVCSECEVDPYTDLLTDLLDDGGQRADQGPPPGPACDEKRR
jgi:hypothetical protein